MRRHSKKLALLLAGVALAACVLLALFSGEREPSYQGRGLSEWTARITNTETPEAFGSEKEALLHMGTNIFPYLVEWACYITPNWRQTLQHLCNNYSSTVPRSLRDWANKNNSRAANKDDYRAVYAMCAFGLLRTNAYPALRELNLIATNSQNAPKAARANMAISFTLFGVVNPDSVKAKGNGLLHDPDPIVRQAATNSYRFLQSLGGPAYLPPQASGAGAAPSPR